ncbi:MAG: DUF1028 domain-containing protein [Anaerolineae bacterium]|nr:DUF1028 domain-containing protein [Anaerolineae bacterium]
MKRLNTFSIVAYDPAEEAWGVAVASKFLAAGAVVSWARAGAGAVATQALARVSFGTDGLAMLAAGKSASETLAALLAADPGREDRQVGIVDAHGGAAAHTGASCFAWAGHRVGEGFTCQGNILTGPETLDAMAETFQTATGELADRLVAALLAGDTAGGDRRGKQAAGVLVVRHNGGYGGDNDRYLDLRVDDDPEPVKRLQELVAMHHLFFGKPRPEDQLPIDESLARELQALLLRAGYAVPITGVWDTASQQAFWALVSNENLEERWAIDRQPDRIDQVAMAYLRRRFPGG